MTVPHGDATTLVLPRAEGERDPTVVRPTLRVGADRDRTLVHGAPVGPLPHQALTLPKDWRLHEYRIDRKLGQGGFGITYLATDIYLGAEVAIKEYLPEEIAFRTGDRRVAPNASHHLDRYRQGLENFLTEARTLATFRHPSIVRVARFFEANDTAYMVLEYERGRSLKKWWLARPKQGERLLLERLQPLLSGLAIVHEAGYLHRDIKPDNIQVRAEDGRFVLLDFGSAGQTVALADQDAVVVTPGYAPLEQYGLGEQGAWTDIYALGATLYWVVAGRKPPDAESRAGGAAMPSAAELGRGRFDARFLDAVDWALQMDPAQRPRSVEQWSTRLLAGLVDGTAALPLRGESSFGATVADARPERPLHERVRRTALRLVSPRSWPLAAKVMLAAAASLPALGAVAVQFQGVQAALFESHARRVEMVAREGAARVAQLLGEHERLARGLADDDDVTALVGGGDDALRERVQRRLRALLASQPALASVSVADAFGQPLAAAADAASPGSSAATEIAAPVRAADAARAASAASVRLSLRPQAIAAVLDAPRAGAATPWIVDAAGRPLAGAAPDAALLDASRTFARGGSLHVRASAGGADRFAGFAPVAGRPWLVGVAEPRSAAEGALRERFTAWWLLACAAALVLVLWMLRVGRDIARTVQDLTTSAHAVKAGTFDRAQVDATRRDELGQLARAFNVMVDVLRQRERERAREHSRRR